MAGSLFLEGEKVELRTIEEEDLEFFRDTVNHPDVRWGITVDRPKNMEDEREWFENLDDENVTLAICVNGETAGNIALRDQNEGRRAEIGISLHPDFHGNGYGSEAVELIIDYAFDELNYRKLEARAHELNEASRNIWEKFGFQEEGVRRDAVFVDGEYLDAFYYGLLRSEWRDRS